MQSSRTSASRHALWRRALAAMLLLAGLLAAPASARAEEFKDERLGYSINFPRKWERRVVATNERWIVAKFECDREYEDSDPKNNFWTLHRPWLDVVIIPLALGDQKGGSVTKGPDGKVRVTEAAPWTDLKGYLEKNLVAGEGGFYFSAEEETEVGGKKCMQYEVTFDKLVNSPKKVWAWAYYTDDAIYGLVGESLVRFEDKIKPDLVSAFKSFKSFQRTGVLPGAEHTGKDLVVGGDTADDEADPDLKRRRREENTNRRLARIKESLPSDWTIKESKNFIAVSHSDSKYTKEILDHCETYRDWLEDNLSYLGTGYTGRIIVRICADRDEYEALTSTGTWEPDRVEVTTYKDKEGWSSWGPIDGLNGSVWSIWLRDRNKSLQWALPTWVSSGLSSVLRSAESKRGKINFRPDTWDRVSIMQKRRDHLLVEGRNFFRMTSADLFKDWSNTQQGEFFVRFLLLGGARKSSKWKNVFSDYMKAVVFVLDEMEAERIREEKKNGDKGPDEGPKNEKEEEEMIRRRQESWRTQEKAFLDRVYERVFSKWSDKDWDQFDAGYFKDLE